MHLQDGSVQNVYSSVADERMLVQHKSIKELHASLTLPLVTNASLVFLKRHLALSPSQLALIDESLKANSARQESFQRKLADAETEVRIQQKAHYLK